MKRDTILKLIPYIIIVALLLAFMILFSCEKPELVKKECWTCTEYTGLNIVHIWTECDVLEASHQDGRRWLTYTRIYNPPIPGQPDSYSTLTTVHTITCE